VLRSTSLPRRAALYEFVEDFALKLTTTKDWGSSRAPVNAKRVVALMFLGLRILDQPDVETKAGKHTLRKTKLSIDRVRATLGWSTNTVVRCYQDLATQGVVTYQKGSAYTAAAYGLASRNRKSSGDSGTTDGYELSLADRLRLIQHRHWIAALVDGHPHPAADILRCARHPALAYCDVVDEVQLVVAFADAAGLHAETLGISAAAAIKARKATARLRSLHGAPTTFPELLDVIADSPGMGPTNDSGKQLSPRDAQVRALGWYEGIRAENKARAIKARERNVMDADASVYVRQILDQYPSPIGPNEHRRRDEDANDELIERQWQWVDQLHVAVLSRPPLPELRDAVTVTFRDRLMRCGFKREAVAIAVATFVVQAPADGDLEDYLVADEEDDERPQRSA
jgi:hypothetical protein